MVQAIVLGGLMAGAVSADVSTLLQEEFEVKKGGTLIADLCEGDIRVRTWKEKKVRVELDRQVDADNEDQAQKVLERYDFQIREDKGVVSVIVRQRSKKWWNWKNDLDLDLTVFVPRKYNADLNTAGGAIEVDQLEGELNCDTAGGSIRIGEVKGEIEAGTSGGKITLDRCEGNAKVETSGGSIKVGEVSGDLYAETSGGHIRIERAGGSVYAHTSGGGIRLDEAGGPVDLSTSGGSIHANFTRQPDGDSRMSTSAGSVNVGIKKGLDFDLRAETSAGRIHSDFPVDVEGEFMTYEARGKINRGGPRLVLETSAGSIELNEL